MQPLPTPNSTGVTLPSISSFPTLPPQPQTQLHTGFPARPTSRSNKRTALAHDLCDKLKEEFTAADNRIEGLLSQVKELTLQYTKHYEIAHTLNAEVNKQTEINARYQGILNQLLPMLKPDVQQGVMQDIESIKSIADAPIPAPPPPPFVDVSD